MYENVDIFVEHVYFDRMDDAAEYMYSLDFEDAVSVWYHALHQEIKPRIVSLQSNAKFYKFIEELFTTRDEEKKAIIKRICFKDTERRYEYNGPVPEGYDAN